MKNEFKEKFIAFVDILGFKSLVEAAENNSGLSIAELNKLRAALEYKETRTLVQQYGPMVCPDSPRIERNLDFQISQASDCTVVSAEISPAGIINLVAHCSTITLKLLMKGVMVRGYITRGKIFHPEGQFPMGTGYHNALDKEDRVTAFKEEADELGTPFIEIDPSVCEYVELSGDICAQKMYSRMTKRDEAVAAIFPFHRLAHSFSIGIRGVNFDPDKERSSNNIVRGWINDFKERIRYHTDESNPSAMRKARHYIKILDNQMKICDQTEEAIDSLCAPFPPRTFGDLWRK